MHLRMWLSRGNVVNNLKASDCSSPENVQIRFTEKTRLLLSFFGILEAILNCKICSTESSNMFNRI